MFGKKKKASDAAPEGERKESWKDIADGQVTDWIASNARFFPDKIAAIDLYSKREFSFAQMHERVAQAAGVLMKYGVERGDRVAVLSLNSSDMLEIQFACWRIGAIYLPLNFRLTAKELAFIVGDAAPAILFIDDEFAETAEGIRAEVHVPVWVSTDGLGAGSDYENALAEADPIYEMVPQAPGDLCMIMYSSGTTGLPKGVTFNHSMMAFNTLNCAPGFLVSQDMVGFTVMPLFHIGGMNAFCVLTLYFGATSVIMRTFEPGAALDIINDPKIGVTHFLGVPAIFNALKDHPKNAETDFSRMRFVMAGAETVPEGLVRWWYDRGLVIQEVYGMTETCGAACFLARGDVPVKIGSAGRALRHCEIMIARDDGSCADPNEVGEIWMRGATITPGYWNRDDANAQSYVNGWFRSGDIGRMDADGYVYVEDRLKDMYISGGENVYPAEVENVLYEIPEIAELAVIGVPDDKWGEVGCAVVVPRPDTQVTIEMISAACEGRLARFKHPVHIVQVESLPRNATGKVLKFELRKSIPEKLAQSK